MLAEPVIDDASCAVCGTHPRAICSSCVSAGLQGKIGFGLGVDYPPEKSIEKCFYCRRREAEWCWQCYSCASANSYGLAHYADHDLQNGYDARYYVVITSIEGSKFQTQIGPIGSSIDPLVRACRPPDHFKTSERATSTPAGRLSVYAPEADAAVEMHKRLVRMVRDVPPSEWADYSTSHFGASLNPGRQLRLYRAALLGLAAAFVVALLAIMPWVLEHGRGLHFKLPIPDSIVNGLAVAAISFFALILLLYVVASIQEDKGKRGVATIPSEPNLDQTSESSPG